MEFRSIQQVVRSPILVIVGRAGESAVVPVPLVVAVGLVKAPAVCLLGIWSVTGSLVSIG